MKRTHALRRSKSLQSRRSRTVQFETLEDRKLLIAGPMQPQPLPPNVPNAPAPPPASVGTINLANTVVTVQGTENTLDNPWGYNNSLPGEIWLTWAEIQSNCVNWVKGAA